MDSRIRAAIDVHRREGTLSLAEKTFLYLARQTSYGDDLLFSKSLSEVRNRMAAERDLDDILDTVLDVKPGYPPYQLSLMQLRDEIEALVNLVNEKEPENVLEIGSANGGSFYLWSRYLKTVDQLVSLDLPGGKFGGGYNERKIDMFREFHPSKEMHFMRANSHNQETFEAISEIVEGSVDFLFIDGDHTYRGVKQDFEMYSQLVSAGGIVALHDIATHPDDLAVVDRRRKEAVGIEDRHLSWSPEHVECNVDEFWSELISEYETEEILSHPKQSWAGIGIVQL